MKSHDAFFQARLSHFVEKHREAIAQHFDQKAEDLTHADMCLLLEHSIGDQMRAYFERKGRFDTSVLQELELIPPSERTIKALSNKIARAEIGMAMNKPIHKAKLVNPEYGPAIEPYILEYRRNRMRKEMEALVATSRDIEAHTLRLLSALDRFRDQPNFENRLMVKAAMTAVNKSLLRAHRRARIGAVWALRSGFSSEAVTKAIHRLYVKRMRTLATGMSKLDTHIGKHGIQSNFAKGITRRNKIISRELLSASANPELLRKSRYAKDKHTDILSGLSHG